VTYLHNKEAEFREFVDFLFQSRREGVEGFVHASMGMAFESGEVGDHMKKAWVYDRPFDRDEIIEEMGDTLHYFFMMLIKLSEGRPSVGLGDIIDANMAKLRKRYPNGFTKHDAIARTDKQQTRVLNKMLGMT
jgi:NTP pyrophosphatase (non-canonical NTP hydrolase)